MDRSGNRFQRKSRLMHHSRSVGFLLHSFVDEGGLAATPQEICRIACAEAQESFEKALC